MERVKYSRHGGYSVKSFPGVPTSIVTSLMMAANHSLAKNTWSSYKTAERHVARCEAYTGIRMRIPFGPVETLTYIGYLREVRKVAASTVEKYMSGLRVLHLKEGHVVPALRPDIVSAVLTGAAQMDEIKRKLLNKPTRMAMTLPMMELFKYEISNTRWSLARKRTVWFVAALCFSGSFRIHEIVARETTTFDPTVCLLGKDLKLITMQEEGKAVRILQVHLKSPKEEKLAKGVTVEVFETGCTICPVKAFIQWRRAVKIPLTGVNSSKPAVRLETGVNYTGKQMNEDLRKLLSKHVDYKIKKFLSHSFRAGFASLMASLGYSDQEDNISLGEVGKLVQISKFGNFAMVPQFNLMFH